MCVDIKCINFQNKLYIYFFNTIYEITVLFQSIKTRNVQPGEKVPKQCNGFTKLWF